MQKLFNKIVPLGAMAACTMWCCWSQIRESVPLLAATEASLPRIERKLLDPELSPVSERDSFLQHKLEPPPSTETNLAHMQDQEPPFDPQSVLPSIRLDATILGKKRLAVINGEIHNEGETLVLQASPKVPCRLQRVLADGIVMTIEKQSYLIGYSNGSQRVAQPMPETNAVHRIRGTLKEQLWEGIQIPGADEVESVSADPSSKQRHLTRDPADLNSEQSEGPPKVGADEDCEFEKNLSNPSNFDEWLKHHDQ